MRRRGREERDAVESRKSRPGRDLGPRKSPDLRLKVEGQPKRRRVQRRDAEHTEITQRGGLQCVAAGIPRGSGYVVANSQRTYYHMITTSVKEKLGIWK